MITQEPSGAQFKLKNREEAISFIDKKVLTGYVSHCTYLLDGSIEVLLIHSTNPHKKYSGKYNRREV